MFLSAANMASTSYSAKLVDWLYLFGAGIVGLVIGLVLGTFGLLTGLVMLVWRTLEFFVTAPCDIVKGVRQAQRERDAGPKFSQSGNQPKT